MRRRMFGITAAAAALALALGMGASRILTGQTEEPDEQQRIRIGFQIAPVKLQLHDRDHDLVGLGSYMVNAVAGCSDCHTQPPYAAGGNPFMGQPKRVNVENYLGGGQPFGPFTSRNLTPEAGDLPAGLTYRQFLLVLRTGIDLDHAHPQFGPLLQVMPWPTYQNMTNREIQAIYEYLRSIPPAPPGS
jgi:hypothetical protein